jgi:hypothetical protein
VSLTGNNGNVLILFLYLAAWNADVLGGAGSCCMLRMIDTEERIGSPDHGEAARSGSPTFMWESVETSIKLKVTFILHFQSLSADPIPAALGRYFPCGKHLSAGTWTHCSGRDTRHWYK